MTPEPFPVEDVRSTESSPASAGRSGRILNVTGRFLGSMALITCIVITPLTVFWWIGTGGSFHRGCSDVSDLFNVIGFGLQVTAALTIAVGVLALLLGCQKRGSIALCVAIPILVSFQLASGGVC